MTIVASVRPFRLFSVSRASGGLALFGLVWSLYGIVQFAAQSFKTPAELMMAGMTAEQATLYSGLPGWMTAAFALGVVGGTVGSALLLAARRSAVPVLLASLAGYLALFAGDAAFGVFAAFGTGQLVILLFVVAVAAVLALNAVLLARAGRLR